MSLYPQLLIQNWTGLRESKVVPGWVESCWVVAGLTGHHSGWCRPVLVVGVGGRSGFFSGSHRAPQLGGLRRNWFLPEKGSHAGPN